MFKLDNTSICSSCKQKVADSQCLKCAKCEGVHHAICTSAPDRDSLICNSTFLSHYLKPSTKPNFSWVCDICKTVEETDKVASLRQLISAMSETHTAQITTLSNLVKTLSDKVDALSASKEEEAPATVWQDQARIQKLKVKSSLVVKPDERGNKVNSNAVQKIAMTAGIPIDSVIESATGETFVNAPDIESRDRVSQLLEEKHSSNPVVKLVSKLPTIAVMGITVRDMKNDDNEDLSKTELEQNIYRQNKPISQLIDQGSQLKVVFTRKPPNGKDYYTVIIRVSPDIRNVLHKMKNKIHIGVSVHSIVDRFHVKRCNRCQGLGHYADKCDTSKPSVCGFCTQHHASDVCPDKKKPHAHHKCINCAGEDRDASGHPAFWAKCPAYMAAQEKMKKTISYEYSVLN